MALVLARIKTLCLALNRRGGAKNSRPFVVMGAALTFFVMKARFNFLMYLPSGALYHQVGNARLL